MHAHSLRLLHGIGEDSDAASSPPDVRTNCTRAWGAGRASATFLWPPPSEARNRPWRRDAGRWTRGMSSGWGRPPALAPPQNSMPRRRSEALIGRGSAPLRARGRGNAPLPHVAAGWQRSAGKSPARCERQMDDDAPGPRQRRRTHELGAAEIDALFEHHGRAHGARPHKTLSQPQFAFRELSRQRPPITCLGES